MKKSILKKTPRHTDFNAKETASGISLPKRCMAGFIFIAFMLMSVTGFVFAAINISKPVVLSYEGGIGNNREVIRGCEVIINATNTENNSVPDNETPIRLERGDTTNNTQYFNIGPDKKHIVFSPILASDLPVSAPPGKPNPPIKANAAKGTYNVFSNFSVMKWKADTASSLRYGGDFELIDTAGGRGFNILTTSSISLIYNYNKIDNKNDDSFTLGSGTGVFRNYQPSVIGPKHHPGTSKTDVEYFELPLAEQTDNGSVITKNFKFTPGQNGTQKVIDKDGNEKDEPWYNIGENPEIQGDNQTTVYTITYNYDQSSKLTLTVMDPEVVLTNIAESATADNLKNNKYIELSDKTNISTFITSKMELQSITEIYNEEVRLDWKWIPNNPNTDTNKVLTLTAVSGKPTTAEVNRMMDDVPGKLEVTTYYSTNKLNNDVTDKQVVRTLDIIVKGKGIPPSLDRISTYVGTENGTDIEDIFKKGNLPKELKLDAYKNEVAGYPATKLPYKVGFDISLGTDSGHAKKVYMELLNADGTPYKGATVATATALVTNALIAAPYEFGTPFTISPTASTLNFTLRTQDRSKDKLILRFRYMVEGPNNTEREEIDSRQDISISFVNSTPDTTAKLEDIIITHENLSIKEFTFKKDVADYSIKLPFEVDTLVLKPSKYKYCQPVLGVKVEVLNASSVWTEAGKNEGWTSIDEFSNSKDWVEDWANQGAAKGYSLNLDPKVDKPKSLAITPEAGKPMLVTFSVRSQHPVYTKKYTIEILRAEPSDNSFLTKITFDDINGKNLFTTPLQKGVFTYDFEVPYKTKSLRVLPTTENKGAFIKEDDYSPKLEQRNGAGTKDWWNLKPFSVLPTEQNQMKITVHAQNQVGVNSGSINKGNQSEYVFNLKYALPSTDATLKSLTLTDPKKANIAYDPAFHPVMSPGEIYVATVPYEVSSVFVLAPPNFEEASCEITHTEVIDGILGGNILKDVMFPTVPTEIKLPKNTGENGFEFKVTTTAEDGVTKTEYPIRIHRVPPSTDASLSALTIKDNFGNDLSKMDGVGYSFNSQNTEYMLSVPFETKTVTFTPTATFTNISSIKIGSYTVKNATESVPYALNDKDGIEAVFKIVITPQKDDDPALIKTYTVRVMRKAPSTDARLSKLTVTGVDSFKPMFVPKQLSYTANISKGGGAIITATTNNKFATLTIRGASAVSGTATDPINLMDVNETVPVVVTAQDGKTTATYQIALTDLNLIELSGNADLKDLKVTPGVPSPTAFMPSVTSYSVAVPEDVAAVEIFPVPADPAASYKVYNGSVEIGDQNGNYAQSIADGENPFTVKVTSPDGKATKDYTLNVYRNDEANSGVLKPITPEDINYEVASPIIVDISKYSRVSADVFNTLRDKYPDKTIIFEGNDYSLTFNGKDILRSIPSTTIYDFSLSFTPPAAIADKLRLVLTPYPENALLENVYVTFGYHGDLPAPAALNLSIGQKYGGRTLYWHYFNEERNRIDYYGVVYANTRGNFSLRLTHMSTYIVSTGILYGSENRSGEIALSNNGKKNPNTFGFMAVNSDDISKGNNAFNSRITDETELASSNARTSNENAISYTQLLSFDIKNCKFDPLKPCFLQDLQTDILQRNNILNPKRQGNK